MSLVLFYGNILIQVLIPSQFPSSTKTKLLVPSHTHSSLPSVSSSTACYSLLSNYVTRELSSLLPSLVFSFTLPLFSLYKFFLFPYFILPQPLFFSFFSSSTLHFVFIFFLSASNFLHPVHRTIRLQCYKLHKNNSTWRCSSSEH